MDKTDRHLKELFELSRELFIQNTVVPMRTDNVEQQRIDALDRANLCIVTANQFLKRWNELREKM